MSGPIRVLVAEDSPLFVDALRAVIEAQPDLAICGVAPDGQTAVARCLELRPDLVTMDVQMPRMDGLEAIEAIMSRCPTPILVMTGDPRGQTGELALEALRRGALDLVLKPAIWPRDPAEAEAFCERIRLLASVAVVHHGSRRLRRSSRAAEARRTAPAPCAVVGIAASTGGPPALATVLGALEPDFGLPIAVVQHLAPGFTPNLVRWLQSVCALPVQVARPGQVLRPGQVVLAPDGAHLAVRPGGRLALLDHPPRDGHRPSATVLFESLARSYRGRAAGLVLTGMGRDGAAGLAAIRQAGGITAAQDRDSSVVWGMPRAAVERGAVQVELPLEGIGRWLGGLAPRRSP